MKDTGFKLKGEKLFEGDILQFTYGIPVTGVNAPIVFKDGAWYVITKGHNPGEMLLCKFLNMGIDIYKRPTDSPSTTPRINDIL